MTGTAKSGYGPIPRKEDARLIRGRGTFVDDISLPGMLHAAILRSPYAHARIRSLDVTAARAHPMVEAVLTGEDLMALGLAWMPTLSGDVQAVLATDKVRFQGQEIAFVVARDRYAARDALELIAVDYEPLEPVMDALTALDPGAPVIRDDLPGRADNHIFDWSAGDKEATDAGFAAAGVVVGCDMVYPRSHPAPLETCGIVADLDQVSEKLTIWMTSQAPHAHRTIYATVTGLPEHKIRIVSPDLGGGALMQSIVFDTDGNCLGGSFMDYLLPTAMECPSWELGATVTPSPHHPVGVKGIGESATVGSPAAVVNSVLDALAPLGVRHADMPLTPARVWRAIQGRPVRPDLAVD
jgi:CO/xanthine dehydrogenase Mo-binding subunit